MRYELDGEGYICKLFFGCLSGTCTEYTGNIPTGYATLEEWAENANIRAYKVIDGNLTYDETRNAELLAEWQTEWDKYRPPTIEELDLKLDETKAETQESIDLLEQEVIGNYVTKDKAAIIEDRAEEAMSAAENAQNTANVANDTANEAKSTVDAQNTKISRLEHTVDELNSKIGDIADITISKESNSGILEFEGINESEPIRVEIRPSGENISYLYPSSGLFPSSNLYPKTRKLRFTNTTTAETVDYELPTDLLYFDSENCDEFVLDYNAQTCIVNKRVGYNADGTTYVLTTPTTVEYEYPVIPLADGDYKVELLGYNTVYMFVRLMVQNIYTTQFATKAEVKSEINQTSTSIKAEVNQSLDTLIEDVNASLELKVNTKDLVSELNASADVIDLKSNRFKLESDNLSVTADGKMTCNDAVIKGSAVINEVVTIDKNGIEMADGTSIVGATGVFSIFEYDGEVSGYNPVRNGEYQVLGASYVYELGVVESERMILDAYIPDNFTIQKAYIHFSHYPIDAIWQNASIGAGYCRELKLYKANAESMQTQYLIGSEYSHTYEDDTSEEIVNAFGVASYTPSSSGLSDIETIDIANKLTTGKNRLIIKSAATMPTGDDETIMKQCALMTGMVQATLVVLGFSK